MLYENTTEQKIKVRTGTIEAYTWHTIKPGETIELPEESANDTGLTLVGIENEKQKEQKTEDTNIAVLDYKGSIKEIKGLGPKYATEIIKNFQTREKLIQAIESGKMVHKIKRIDTLVKENYK